MRPELRFEKEIMKMSCLGEEASIPDLAGGLILQNNLEFHLGEEEEIYEGYGKRRNSYPYRQYNSYDRKLEEKEVSTAVLENDFIKAVFLPELGGRLWSLTDKKTGKNLLYTNDVIRFSNLAVRNAWFSGGVEWNLGVIGHTPFTTEPLHTARLTLQDGTPVLRMYEYERIRGVEYQMDFWLGTEDTCLNCRMRIVNTGNEVVPMYWWSNMAVPEHEDGRLVVPAEEAYTSIDWNVYKKKIPYVDGKDVSYYKNIPNSIDYFFHIKDEKPKYIANLDKNGYGLLHMSTSRLKSRKLFVWGQNPGSDRWQSFLTENAGRYVEIQAGLAKTQYGCLPMAPHTAWEWLEQYGALQVTKEEQSLPYEELEKLVTAHVEKLIEKNEIEAVLERTKTLAKTEGEIVSRGSSWGSFERKIREYTKDRELSGHLDYGECSQSQKELEEFLATGIFPESEADAIPAEFLNSRVIYEKLKETIDTKNKENWYAHYHLGLLAFYFENREEAEKVWEKALTLSENPWIHHALASLFLVEQRKEEAVGHLVPGVEMRKEDLSYIKESFHLLCQAEAYESLLELYKKLPENIQKNDSVYFQYILSLSYTGQEEEAYRLLMENQEFVPADIREGDVSLGALYQRLYEAVYHKKPESVPSQWDFGAFVR